MPPNILPQVILEKIDVAAAMEEIRNGTYRFVDESLAKVANKLNANSIANDDSSDESNADQNDDSSTETASDFDDAYGRISFPGNEKHSNIRSIHQLIDDCILNDDRIDGIELYPKDDDIDLPANWEWLCDETDWGRRIAIDKTKLEHLCLLNSAEMLVSSTRASFMKDFVQKRIHTRSSKNRFYEAVIEFNQSVQKTIIGKLVPRYFIDAQNKIKWELFVVFKDPESDRHFWFKVVNGLPTVHKELVLRCIKSSSRKMDDLTSCPAMLKLRLPNTSNRIEDFFYTDVECSIVNGTHACNLCVCDALLNGNSANFGFTRQKWVENRDACLQEIRQRLQH